jgi:hypothetical protein
MLIVWNVLFRTQGYYWRYVAGLSTCQCVDCAVSKFYFSSYWLLFQVFGEKKLLQELKPWNIVVWVFCTNLLPSHTRCKHSDKTFFLFFTMTLSRRLLDYPLSFQFWQQSLNQIHALRYDKCMSERVFYRIIIFIKIVI